MKTFAACDIYLCIYLKNYIITISNKKNITNKYKNKIIAKKMENKIVDNRYNNRKAATLN